MRPTRPSDRNLSILRVLALGFALQTIPQRPGTAAAEAVGAALPGGGYAETVAPFLESHCIGCHQGDDPKGGLSLEVYRDASRLPEDRAVWDIVARRIEAREMPPRRRPQPTPEEIEGLLSWLRAELGRIDGEAPRDPGRVTIRRLNRTEYSSTVRDLLGVQYVAEDEFPADDVGYGFDNIGDVLSLPPLLLERYLDAAERIAAQALTPGSSSREGVFICRIEDGASPEARLECARKIVERLASRAYRRPVTPEELEGLLGIFRAGESMSGRTRTEESGPGTTRAEATDGGTFEDGIRLVLTTLLVSPHFLFRVELDPAPEDAAAVHPVGDHELASRLSYFLWSSMPDDELFAKARDGSLRRSEVLEAQVRRMLRDPRSRSLIDAFATQWLQIRSIRTATPDRGMFPAFDEELRSAMLRETELFLESLVKEDRSLLELLDADYTFANERLAKHYGIEGVTGAEFRRVDLSGTPRRGILAHASVLTVTSNPTRTSPVKRGKWVLEVLLGAPPPPPPPNVPDLSDKPEAVLSGSLRQRMEQHRADPACATCHETMDPLGFGLENFDATGAWRERDGTFPIDASGVLPDGRSFNGPKELSAILKDRRAAFRRALAEKALTFALGRGVEPHDGPAVAGIVKALESGDDRFSELVLAIVKSDPFQLRRGERGSP